jgi:hypothetical protein
MNQENRNKQALRETYAICMQVQEMSKAVFLSALQAFIENRETNKKGKTTLKDLRQQSDGKLENVKITDQNIGDFTETARKYDIDYALKRDKSTEPPTWYVFFKTNEKRRDTLNRAMTEYTAVALGKSEKQKAVTTPEKVRQLDKKIRLERQMNPPKKKKDRGERGK